MKICDKIHSNSRPHIDLSSNYDRYETHLKNTLQFFTALNNHHRNLYENFDRNHTHHLLFQIILKYINHQNLDENEKADLIKLSKSIRFDTEHDFGTGASGTRDNCKTELVQNCVRSRQQGEPSLKQYVQQNLTPLTDCCEQGTNNISNQCIKDLNDINYIIKDTPLKGLAKVAMNMSGGKDIYRGISSSIDPAGCRKKKQGEYSVADLINFDKELFIYNIGLIFYQSFYNVFVNNNICMWISIENNRNDFDTNKRFNINIVNYTNPAQRTVINNVLGGANSLFSPQNICRFLNSKINVILKAYPNIPEDYEFVRGFQLVMKGYGDFGQLFWTMYLYFTSNLHQLGFYIQEPSMPFYNNCMLTTIDTYLAAIGSVLNAPIILGTDVGYHKYIIDINIKYYGQPILETYNLFNKLKYYSGNYGDIPIPKTEDQIQALILNDQNNDIHIMADEYNEFYNECIKHYYIEWVGNNFVLCKIPNASITRRRWINSGDVILANLDFWKKLFSNGAAIGARESYPSRDRNNEFINYRNVMTDRTYYNIVNIEIFLYYLQIIFTKKLIKSEKIYKSIYDELSHIKEMRARKYTDSPGSLVINTMKYFYYIKSYGYDNWKRTGYSSKDVPNSVTNTEQQFKIINLFLTKVIQFSEFIHNKINTCYNNVKTLDSIRVKYLENGQPFPEIFKTLLDRSINILLNNKTIDDWRKFITVDVCNYFKLQIINAIYNIDNANDDFYPTISDQAERDFIDKTSDLDLDYKAKQIPPSATKGIENCQLFLKELIDNIKYLSTYDELIYFECNRIKTVKIYIDEVRYMQEDELYENNIDSVLKNIEDYDNKLNNQDCPDKCDGNACLINVEPADIEYIEELNTGIAHDYNKLIRKSTEPPYDEETDMNDIRAPYIMRSFIILYTLILNTLYRYLVKTLNNRYKKLTDKRNFNDKSEEEKVLTEEEKKVIHEIKTIEEEKHRTGEIIHALIDILDKIIKNTDYIIYETDQQFAGNKELLYQTFEFTPQELTEIRGINNPDLVQTFFRNMFYNRLINNPKFKDINPQVINNLIYHESFADDRTLPLTTRGTWNGGGNYFNNIEAYLKKIENIKKKIKILNKNKNKNKNKIIAQYDDIKKIKLKIKKEKEKIRKQKENEKDKLKKQKEKEKEKIRKQKENEKEKIRKKKENEKNKLKKQKEKEKLKKQKENEKEKIRKQNEKEKLREQKEKLTKENGKKKLKNKKEKKKQ